MQPNNVVINILVNANATQGAQQFQNLMVNIKSQATTAAKEASSAFTTYFGANFFADLASNATRQLVSGFASGISEMTKFAARTEELGVALTGIAKVNNLNADAVRNTEKALKDANIATQTAREVLTRYIAAALPLEKATPLANVAKDLAVISGTSSSEEFERLIVGITTLNNRVLRNAGVYIQAADAEKKFAEQKHVSVTELNTEEKQLAVLNGVLEFGSRAQGLYGLAMDTTAKQMRSLERIQQDFSDAVGAKLVPILGVLVSVYGALLKAGTALPGPTILLTTALIGLAGAAALSMTSFTSLTVAEIANAAASNGLVKILQTAILVMTDFEYITALTAGEIAVLSAGTLAVIGILAALVIGIGYYISTQTEAVRSTNDQVKALVDKQEALKDEANTLKLLDPLTKMRITNIENETEKTKQLAEARTTMNQATQLQLQVEALSRATDLTKALQEQLALTERLVGARERLNNPTAGISVSKYGTAEQISQSQREDQNRTSAAMIAINTALTAQEEKTRIAAVALKEYADITHKSIPDILESVNGHNELGIANNVLADAIAKVTAEQKQNQTATTNTTSAITKQIQAIYEADSALHQTERKKIIQGQIAEIAELSGGDLGMARRLLKQRGQIGVQVPGSAPGENMTTNLDTLIKQSNAIDNVATKLGDQITPKIHKTKTEFQNLTDQVRKLNDEIQSYTNLNAPEFTLRFQKEELERQKRDFETIISMRRDLGIPLNSSLPGTAAGAKTEIERLERIRSIHEDILKISHEQLDAEAKLQVVREASTMAVVDAQTRADTSYYEGVRKKADAEQQLTADIITEIRRRDDFKNQSVRNTANYQAEAYKDFIQKQNDSDESRAKTRAKLELLLGGSFSGNPLIPGPGAKIPETASPVIQRMDRTNQLLESINTAVGGNNASSTGSSAPVGRGVIYDTNTGKFDIPDGAVIDATTGMLTFSGGQAPLVGKSGSGNMGLAGGSSSTATPAQTLATFDKIKQVYPELNKLALQYFHITDGSKRLTDESYASILAYGEGQKKLNDVGLEGIKNNVIGQDQLSQKTNVQITQVEQLAVAEDRLKRIQMRDSTSVLETLQEMNIARTKELENLEKQAIIQENLLLGHGGRDREMEAAQLKTTRNGLLLGVGTSAADLDKARTLNSDEAVQNARKITMITNERVDLENQLTDLQNQQATGPYNQALREQVAIQQELLNIQKADLDARTQIAAISVQMADKTVYHQDQANAKVLEHINQVKSLTDLYADAKINIVDGLFGGIDNIFGKLTGRFPILSQMLNQFLSGLTKLFLSPILGRLLGTSGGGSGSGSSGGSGIGGFLGGLFGGGGFGSGGGIGGTPNFNGGNFTGSGSSALDLLSGGYGGSILTPSQMLGGSTSSGSAGLLQQLLGHEAINQIRGTATGAGTSGLGTLVNGGGAVASGGGMMGGLSGLLGSAALGLPLIGAGLGSSLFTASKPASILGGIGGALGGAAVLAGGLSLFAGTGAAAGIAGALGPGLTAGLLSIAPFAAVAAPLLILGAFLLNRNAKRRQQEQQRTQILLDSKAQMQSVIDNIRSGQMDSASALTQANAIRANYIQQVSQLSDKKTRDIALQTVRELDAMIEIVKSEGRRADYAKSQEDSIVPTFAQGGYVGGMVGMNGGGMSSVFTGYGGASYGDMIPIMASRDEAVLNRQSIMNLGGYDALRRAGVRGMNMFPRGYDTTGKGGGSAVSNVGSNQPIYNIMVGSEKAANELFAKVKGKGIARKVKLAVYSGDDDGLANTIESKLAGEF